MRMYGKVFVMLTKRVLGIESSCDETAVSIIEVQEMCQCSQSDDSVMDCAKLFFYGKGACRVKAVPLQEMVATHDHKSYGGVVPESASRQHFFFLPKMIEKLETNISEMDMVCATYGPGLIGGLMLGLAAGKAVALTANKPFYPVDHIKAHALSAMMENGDLKFPYVCLIVSGGHTLLIKLESFDSLSIIARTRDDAMGELFDKVAHYMGFDFPGGKMMEELAKKGDSSKHKVKLPDCKAVGSYTENDFSFSGLKTSFIRKIDQLKLQSNGLSEQDKCDIAAAVQDVVCRICVQKWEYVAKETVSVNQWAMAGGVGSNKAIRQACLQVAEKHGKQIFFPSIKLCTDNATMIAWAGYLASLNGEKPNENDPAKSSLGW